MRLIFPALIFGEKDWTRESVPMPIEKLALTRFLPDGRVCVKKIDGLIWSGRARSRLIYFVVLFPIGANHGETTTAEEIGCAG